MLNGGEIDLTSKSGEEPEKSPFQPPEDTQPVNANTQTEEDNKINTNVKSPDGKDVPIEIKVESSNAPESKHSRQKFEEIERKFNRNILEIKTLFPFKLFPTYIIVDEAQVIIIDYYFFFSKRVFPMFIKDIKTVTASYGILLANMKFELSGYEDNPGIVNDLKRGDAIRARRIILGLMKATDEKIDLSQFSDDELRKRLEMLGEKYGKA